MPSRGDRYIPEAAPDLPQRYTVDSVLNSDGAETVFLLHDTHLAMKLLGKQVAYYAASAADHSEVIGQTFILKHIEHPTLMKVYDIFYAPYKSTFTLVTEYLPRSLYSVVEDGYCNSKRLSEAAIWDYIAQITDALIYLHSPWNKSYKDSQGEIVQIGRIVHRRLTPRNILFNNVNQLKISNFSIPTAVDVMFSSFPLFDLAFMAPEVLSGEEAYSLKSDIWSFGCVIYYMCTGQPCFWGRTPSELADNVASGKYVSLRDAGANYSDSLQSLISRFLQLDMAHRPTSNELMEHPFIIRAMRNLGLVSHSSSPKYVPPQLEQPPIAVNAELSKNLINLVNPSANGVSFEQVEFSHKTPTTAIKSALSTVPLLSSLNNSGIHGVNDPEHVGMDKKSSKGSIPSPTTSTQSLTGQPSLDGDVFCQQMQYDQQSSDFRLPPNAGTFKQAMNRSSNLSLHPDSHQSYSRDNQVFPQIPGSELHHRSNLRDVPEQNEEDGYSSNPVPDNPVFGDGYELTSSISLQDAYPNAVSEPRPGSASTKNEPVVTATDHGSLFTRESLKGRSMRADSLGGLHGAHDGVYRSNTYCYDDGELVGADNINFSKMQPISDSDHDDSGHLHTPRNNDINMSITPRVDQTDFYGEVFHDGEDYDHGSPASLAPPSAQQGPHPAIHSSYNGSRVDTSESIKEAIAKAKNEISIDQARVRDADIPQTGDDYSIVPVDSKVNPSSGTKSVRIDPAFNTDSVRVGQDASVRSQVNDAWQSNDAIRDPVANETISSIAVMRSSRIKPTVNSFQTRMEDAVAMRRAYSTMSEAEKSMMSFAGASIREPTTMSMRARDIMSQNIYQDNSFNNPEGEYYTMGTGPAHDGASRTLHEARSQVEQNDQFVHTKASGHELLGDNSYVTPAESETDRWCGTTINGFHPTMSFRLNIQEDSNFQGRTPLMEAVISGSVDMVNQRLTWAGAQDNLGLTALMLAVINKNVEMVHILLPYEKQMQDKAGWTALMWASHYNLVFLIETLFVEVTMRDIYGRTALMIAAQNGYVGVVESLYQSEACTQRKDGYTALMHAASCGVVEVYYTHTDRELGTPYHSSAGSNVTAAQKTIELMLLTKRGTRQDYINIIELLHKNESGLTSNKLCSYGAGLTALMIAANFNFAPACSILYESESTFYQSDGKRAEDYATESNANDAQAALEGKTHYQHVNFVDAEADLGPVEVQGAKPRRQSAKKNRMNAHS
ncbi:Serine/threonine-protein kinase NEK [Giardia duodenalis]|uniref:Serine/threonine-protein kinase NEK n=1 Tax=Giardia intestinalis TaxID=5741 RepID=V6TKF0_GIAIN|nr:Serine/threonine-protein kinase NEK [Giardia intestinalis]